MSRSFSIFGLFNNLRIKQKLLLTYIVLIVIPVGSISWISYHKTSGMVEQRIVDSTRRSFEQANTFISYKLNNVKDVSSMLFMNKSLNEILANKDASYTLSQQIDDYQILLEIIRSAQNSREIYGIRLYVNNDWIYSRENSTILPMKEAMQTEWFRDMLSNQDGIYCRPTYEYDFQDMRGVQQILSCVRPLQLDGGFNGRILGVIAIDILEESISEIIRQTNITRLGQVYLTDQDGVIMSGLDKAQIGKRIDLDLLQNDSSGTAGAEGTLTARQDGRPSIVIHKQVEGTSWRLVAIIPQEEISQQINPLARDLLLVLIVVTVIAILTAFWISSGITRRIRLLLRHIRKIEEEQWDFRARVDSTDELGVLQQHFNLMSENMQRLIKEKYEEEVLKKSAELKALQAQINPHFLYNTLDMIHWMALKHKAPEISEVVGMLAKFFRLSLRGGRDIITLQDELEHVRMYLDLQNKRFGGMVDYELECEPGVENCATVKLILQPLVENAILHGIQERKDKRGKIRIHACREEDQIFISVEDNGVGMSRTETEQILAGRPGSGYGVRNVIDKIKLHYGEGYGLSYYSEPGEGTKVVIRYPALPYNEVENSGGGTG